MLMRFAVTNYWGFSDRVEIDFTDKKNYQFGKECVRGDFLDKVVIIGNNGSGKTSFGYALADIVTTVNGFTKDIGQHTAGCFINGSGASDRATFHYEFSFRGSVVTYEYSKTSPFAVASERLLVDRSVVFDYDLADMGDAVFDLPAGDVKAVDVSGLDGTRSLMRLIAETVRPDRFSPVRAVIDFAEHSLYYRAMWRMDDHIGVIDYDMDLSRYIVENGLTSDLEAFLRNECNVDMRIGAENGELVAVTETKSIPFFDAVSRGTAILCRLYGWVMRCRDREATIYFDDFDDLFDYKTAENVMSYIIQGTAAQCVFVTHNLELVSSDHLRPDCCFIMEGGRLFSLASLTDKNIRKGHNLAKMIREGEFAPPGS